MTDRPPPPIAAYFRRQNGPIRAELERLRTIIRAAAPDAEEVISYRMAAFRQDGILVYYGGFARHASLFVASRSVADRFAEDLAPFATGRGTTRSTPESPIPAALLRRIVRARLAENRARTRAKIAGRSKRR